MKLLTSLRDCPDLLRRSEARKAARRARAARRKAERDAVAAGRNVADDPFERSAVVMMGDEANSIDPVEAAAAAEAEAEAARIKAAEETEARAARKAARKARVRSSVLLRLVLLRYRIVTDFLRGWSRVHRLVGSILTHGEIQLFAHN